MSWNDAVRLLAIPPLPDRRRALLHLVQPRRILFSIEQQLYASSRYPYRSARARERRACRGSQSSDDPCCADVSASRCAAAGAQRIGQRGRSPSASTYAVCVFAPTRPSASRTRAGTPPGSSRTSARYFARVLRLAEHVRRLRASRSVECAKYAVAMRSLSVVAPG